MSYLGDISTALPRPHFTRCFGAFTKSKQPLGVYVNVPNALPGNRMHLFTQAGTYVDRSNVDYSGFGNFFTLDDGGYIAYEVGTGNAWSITVSGTTVTIIRLSSFGTLVTVYAA